MTEAFPVTWFWRMSLLILYEKGKPFFWRAGKNFLINKDGMIFCI